MVGHSDFREVVARNLNKISRQERLALQIYSASFPPVETKPVEKVKRMLRTDPDYHLYVARSNGTIVGISLLYVFRRLQIGLLDYIAIVPSHRKKGIGTKLFNYSLEEFRKSANPRGLLIEVQRGPGRRQTRSQDA
jgi:GNAT superfamily N-acetyltransferase